jgi:hypothetical protein
VREGGGRRERGGGREGSLNNFSTYVPLRGSDQFPPRVSRETGGLRICRAVWNPVKFINMC